MALRFPIQNNGIVRNPYGYFRKEGKEFVVTNLATPMPWANIISNGEYGFAVSQVGSGFSWGDNCMTSRVTRWEQDLVKDNQGRYIYIQDLEDPSTVWSTTLQPTLQTSSRDETVHGLGYTAFHRHLNEIESSQTVFVPLEDPCEVWVLKFTNRSNRSRRLRFATYVEWHLGASTDWHHEFHRLFYEVGHERNFLYARKLPGLRPDSRVIEELHPMAFFGVAGVDVSQWIADKSSFLGNPADITSPGFLHGHTPELSNPRWNDPIASAVFEVMLAPGESKELSFILGSVADKSAASALIDKYSVEAAIRELEAVKRNWIDLCEKSQIKTGDPAFDLMNNYWLKYQMYGCRMLARCAYYQQGGAYGYRDQLQDSLGMLSLDPEITRTQLIRHAEAMYTDGGVRHWWHPNTEIYVDSHHSDTSLWVPFGTLAYLDETNDITILDRQCRFLDRQTKGFGETGSLLEHILRGIDRTISKRSERGVPLILSGDWNDGLSHAGVDGKGESFWLGMFLYHILDRWVTLLDEVGRKDKALVYTQVRDQLKSTVNEFGWDGAWYLQGTRDDALPLGSESCSEGKIFLNPQTWAVISGIASDDRAREAMRSARERLVKPYGALLLAPAFSKVDPFVGYITRYAPGLRENGGVYSHASTWMVQALAMSGFQEEAIQLYKAMIPCNGRDADRYVAEPYVMPGNVDGPDSPFEGRAGWTWYTGSSAWMYRIALDWILGVRATRKGLVVQPKAGIEPLSFTLTRQFRGDTFEFDVSGKGERMTVKCDTASYTDGVLQSTGTGATHRVFVVLSE